MKTLTASRALSPAAQAIRDACDRQTAREQLRIKRDAMIASVAETISTDWFRRCVRCPVTMSLWWRKPRAGEKAARDRTRRRQLSHDALIIWSA